MGRIEEAVAKLQARQRAGAGAPGGVVRQQPLGRVSRGDVTLPDMETSLSHVYRGRRIEIDTEVLHAQRLLAPDSKGQKLADEYRTIKRPLLKNASPGREPSVPRGNLWMVASAMAGEGKTFTCINLSLSVAREQDWSVVLVDGDCNKPHLTRLFGAEEEQGLMDLLRDPTLEFDSLVMPTNIPRLSLLRAGRRDDHAAELLSSARMDALCAALAAGDPHRIVLFDSPPLLLTAEAPALATNVGQVVLVVHANRTPQQAVLAAIERLDSSKAINLVLNQADGNEMGAGYGYGDYYPKQGSAE